MVAAPSDSSAGRDGGRDGVNELSRLLLQGWTMLSETCPRSGCNMPLARSRDQRVRCCACDMDVGAPPPAANGPQPAQAAGEAAREQGGPGRRAAATSASSLESTEAPAVVQAREAGAMVRTTADPAQDTPPAPGTMVPHRRRDDASAALGEKLLQGWTMLDDACARCATPLLRDAEGTLLCVMCSPQRASAAASASDPAPPAPLRLVPHARAPGSPLSAAVVSRSGGSDVARQAARSRAAVPAPAPASGNSARPAPASAQANPASLGPPPARPYLPAPPRASERYARGDGSSPFSDELSATEEAVLATLPGLRAGLAHARDAESIRIVLEAIRSAADAVASLRLAGSRMR